MIFLLTVLLGFRQGFLLHFQQNCLRDYSKVSWMIPITNFWLNSCSTSTAIPEEIPKRRGFPVILLREIPERISGEILTKFLEKNVQMNFWMNSWKSYNDSISFSFNSRILSSLNSSWDYEHISRANVTWKRNLSINIDCGNAEWIHRYSLSSTFVSSFDAQNEHKWHLKGCSRGFQVVSVKHQELSRAFQGVLEAF